MLPKPMNPMLLDPPVDMNLAKTSPIWIAFFDVHNTRMPIILNVNKQAKKQSNIKLNDKLETAATDSKVNQILTWYNKKLNLIRMREVRMCASERFAVRYQLNWR